MTALCPRPPHESQQGTMQQLAEAPLPGGHHKLITTVYGQTHGRERRRRAKAQWQTTANQDIFSGATAETTILMATKAGRHVLLKNRVSPDTLPTPKTARDAEGGPTNNNGNRASNSGRPTARAHDGRCTCAARIASDGALTRRVRQRRHDTH